MNYERNVKYLDKKLKINYIYNLIYQMLLVITSVVVTPFVARMLGSEQLGIYDYCYSKCSIIITLSLLGIGNYGNRAIAYERNKRKKMSITFWEVLSTQLFLGIIALLIFMITLINNSYGEYYIYFIIWIIANMIDCTWFYQGVEEMKYTAIKNIIAKILFVSVVFLFVRSPNDLKKYIILFGISMLIANVAAYFQLRQFIDIYRINVKNIFIHIAGTVELFLPTVATQVLLSIDKLALGFWGTNIACVSFYSNAEKIIQIPLSLVTVMNAVMMPRLANEYQNHNKVKIQSHIIEIGKISLFFAFPLMAGLFTVADNLIPWFLGNEFIESATAMKMLSPIVIGNTLIGLSGNQYFIATDQIEILLKSNIISAIINILLDIILIPKFGLKGACIATVISMFASVLIQYKTLAKQINLSLLWGLCPKYLYRSVVMALVIRIVFNNSLKSSPLITAGQVILGVGVYFLINLITKDELAVKIWKSLKNV